MTNRPSDVAALMKGKFADLRIAIETHLHTTTNTVVAIDIIDAAETLIQMAHEGQQVADLPPMNLGTFNPIDDGVECTEPSGVDHNRYPHWPTRSR